MSFCLLYVHFSDENAIAALKILAHMLPAGGRKRAAAPEAFASVFVVMPVGDQFLGIFHYP
jgi:hypothetical protein